MCVRKAVDYVQSLNTKLASMDLTAIPNGRKLVNKVEDWLAQLEEEYPHLDLLKKDKVALKSLETLKQSMEKIHFAAKAQEINRKHFQDMTGMESV